MRFRKIYFTRTISFMLPFVTRRELSRLQEEQICYMRKTEKEKQRKEFVNATLEVLSQVLTQIIEKIIHF
jgi:hypothetical protein